MQMPDDATNVFPGILQRLADLMSQHKDIREIDEKTLSQCDEELDALQSVQKQLERRVALVRQQQNTFTPLNALPPELLVTIFDIIIDCEPVQVSYYRRTLALVCRHWNHLFNNTPSLWTKIRGDLETPNATIARALKMFQDSPLEVYYDGPDWREVLEHQQAFLSMIFPHAHRWRTACLGIKEAAEALGPMTTFSAPLLESLSLWASDDLAWAGDEPLDIFGGRPPPKLQELTLSGIPVIWSPNNLCNLKVLRIMNIEHLGPSLDQLFAILPASPGLESLFIGVVRFSGDVSVPAPNPIHMPTLGKLWLEFIPSGIIARILAALLAPECKSGSLKPEEVPFDPFEALFTSDTSHFFDHIRSGVGAGEILGRSGGVRVSWEGRWSIVLEVENIRIARRVLDLMSVSPEPNSLAVPLHLAIEAHDLLMGEDILAIMADMEAVHRVELANNGPLAAALEILATGGWGEESTRKSFPGLKEIFIPKSLDDGEWDNLLRVLRSRNGDMEAMVGGDCLNPLCSLELGKKWSMADETFINEFKSIHWPNRLEEVRRLLGRDGRLRWHQFIVAEDGTLEEQHREGPPVWTSTWE